MNSPSEPELGGHDGVHAQRLIQLVLHDHRAVAVRKRLLQDQRVHLHTIGVRVRVHASGHRY